MRYDMNEKEGGKKEEIIRTKGRQQLALYLYTLRFKCLDKHPHGNMFHKLAVLEKKVS